MDHTNSNLAKDASLSIINNLNLSSLKADKVDGLSALTITNNPELETVSFAALKAVPSGGGAVKVTIGGSAATKNAFNATSIDPSNKAISTDSGVDGLKTYLTAADAIAGSTIKAYFDSAEEYDGNAVNYKISVAADVAKLLLIDKAASSSAGKSKRSFIINTNPIPSGSQTFSVNGNTIGFTNTNSTTVSFLAALNDPTVKSQVTTYGATLTTSAFGAPKATAAFDIAASATISSSVTSATTMATAQSVSLQFNKKDSGDAEYIATIYLSTAAISDLTAKTIGASGKTHVSAIVVDGTTTVASITSALAAAFPSGNGKDDGAYTVTTTAAASATVEIAAKDVSPNYHGRGVKLSASSSLGFGGSTINQGTSLDDTLLGTLPVITFESNKEGDSYIDGGLSTIGNTMDPAGTTAGTLTFAGAELTAVETGDTLPNHSPGYVSFGVEPSTGASTNRVAWL